MDPIVPAEVPQTPAPAAGTPPSPVQPVPPAQDPLQLELEKQKRIRKLKFTRERVDEQLKDLGVDLNEMPAEEDDDKPLTRGEFKKELAKTAQKTALELAEAISNQAERELVKFHLENTIRSTGNPEQDLSLAQGLANSARNQQILEEQTRKPGAPSKPQNPGAPIKDAPQEPELTPEEQKFMLPPFNLTKQQILEARTGKAYSFKK